MDLSLTSLPPKKQCSCVCQPGSAKAMEGKERGGQSVQVPKNNKGAAAYNRISHCSLTGLLVTQGKVPD